MTPKTSNTYGHLFRNFSHYDRLFQSWAAYILNLKKSVIVIVVSYWLPTRKITESWIFPNAIKASDCVIFDDLKNEYPELFTNIITDMLALIVKRNFIRRCWC